eukprot:g57114.t1
MNLPLDFSWLSRLLEPDFWEQWQRESNPWREAFLRVEENTHIELRILGFFLLFSLLHAAVLFNRALLGEALSSRPTVFASALHICTMLFFVVYLLLLDTERQEVQLLGLWRTWAVPFSLAYFANDTLWYGLRRNDGLVLFGNLLMVFSMYPLTSTAGADLCGAGDALWALRISIRAYLWPEVSNLLMLYRWYLLETLNRSNLSLVLVNIALVCSLCVSALTTAYQLSYVVLPRAPFFVDNTHVFTLLGIVIAHGGLLFLTLFYLRHLLLQNGPRALFRLSQAIPPGDPSAKEDKPFAKPQFLFGADMGRTIRKRERIQVGILGGTGLVGRLLARQLCDHPFLTIGPVVGSERTAGQDFEEVWHEKERALQEHYGKDLWDEDQNFPPQLKGVKVSSLQDLLNSSCRVAISAVAPRLGALEDALAAKGFTVVSISPYKRQEGILCVLEANHQVLRRALLQARNRPAVCSFSAAGLLEAQKLQMYVPKTPPQLVKSPNCVCCGTSVVLRALAKAFGVLAEVSVTTFQSLSGRGDAMYPAELVVGNVYPLNGTAEKTESLIAEELRTVLGTHVGSLSVTAYRVSVKRGHLVDVRVKLSNARARARLTEAEVVYRALEAFKPLEKIRKYLPSVPERPIICDRAGGAPRPKSHHLGEGGNEGKHQGLSVTVGNVKVRDGPYDIALTLVVDNLVKGALGAALQLLEYTLQF